MAPRTHHYYRRTRSKNMSRRKMARKVMKRRRRTHTRTSSITEVLPVDCIAHILSLTSPRDVCASSLVSSTFKSAADSNHVWEKFLPSDYQDIVSRCPSLRNSQFSSMKHLFSRLCCPILLDGGTKSLNLEKNSGKICVMLGSKELTVTWSDEIRWINATGRAASLYFNEIIDFWKWISPSYSRFAEAIELVNASWLFISGKIETRMLSPNTTYLVFIVLKSTDDAHGFEAERGEDEILYSLAKASVKFVRGDGSASGTHRRSLNNNCQPRTCKQYAPHQYECQCTSESRGGWLELQMGEFYSGSQGKDREVEFILKARDICWMSTVWKEGLIVQGIELIPKESGMGSFEFEYDCFKVRSDSE